MVEILQRGSGPRLVETMIRSPIYTTDPRDEFGLYILQEQHLTYPSTM